MIPVVSKIITTCKRLIEVVERTVYSVIKQLFQKIEIIVGDDKFTVMKGGCLYA